MPSPRGGMKGDLLIQTYIETPKKISKEQEALLRQLAELEQTEVLPERKNFLQRLTEYFATEESWSISRLGANPGCERMELRLIEVGPFEVKHMTDEPIESTENEVELPTPEEVEAFAGEGIADELADNVAGTIGLSEVEQLREQLDEAEKKALMAQADLENARRRIRHESEDRIRYASKGLMTDVLESVDNLYRAVDAYNADPNGDGLRDGVQLVATTILESLAKHGCKPIEANGQTYDPNLHQALQMQPSDDHPANTVMQDVRTGFQLHERVLRPSQVFVSTGPAK